MTVQDKTRTKQLQKELGELRIQIAALEEALKTKPDYGLGQGDPAITQWEVNKTLLQQLQDRVASLEKALSRATEGGYGICERCGEPIHPDRLAILPDTTICIRCAQAGVKE